MTEPIELRKKPVAYVCSSELNRNKLLKLVNEISANEEFMLLTDCKKGIENMLLPAYFNACIRCKSGIAKAKSIPTEMLLFINGTMNIDKAIAEFDKNPGDEFVIFSTDAKLFKKLLVKGKIKQTKKMKLSFDFDVAAKIAAQGM